MQRILILALILGAAPSYGSGLDAPHVGSAHSGPTTADAATIWWNPANLARLKQFELLVGAGLVTGKIGYEREYLGTYQREDTFEIVEPIDPAYIDADKSGKAEAVEANVLSPTGGLFAAAPLTPEVVLGLGLFAPYAAPVDYKNDEGPQRFALQRAFIAVTRVAAAAAVEFHPKVFLGAHVSYVNGVANLAQTQDFGSLSDFSTSLAGPPISQENSFGPEAPTTVRELDVLARDVAIKDATAHGVTFGLGLTIKPARQLTVGVAYDHGSNLDFEGSFELDMDDELFTQDLRKNGLQYEPRVEGDATVSFSTPKRLMVGVLHETTSTIGLELRAAYVTWSDFDKIGVVLESEGLAQPEVGLPPRNEVDLPRRWNDTLNLEGLVHAALSDTLGLLVAIGYQSSASPDETMDASSPDGDRVTAALGLDWGITRDTHLFADARVQTLVPREVKDSENDMGNGTYNLTLAAFGLHLQVRFGESE